MASSMRSLQCKHISLLHFFHDFRESNQQKLMGGGSGQLVSTGPKSLFSQSYQLRMDRRSVNSTVVPTKSDSDVILCLQLLSKTLTCTLHLSIHESIDHLCINPILWKGLIHK